MKPIVCLLCAALAMPATAFADCLESADDSGHPRFVATRGEVFDNRTKLTWRQCSVGSTWTEAAGCGGEKKILELDEAMDAAKEAGPEWRVPNVAELYTLLDDSCGRPAIDTQAFPDVSANANEESGYWATTPVGVADLIYYIDFLTGEVDGHARGFQLAVRLVRGNTLTRPPRPR